MKRNLLIILLFLAGGSLLYVFLLSIGGKVSPISSVPVAPAGPRFYSTLNGEAVSGEDQVVPPVVAIMIDNHPDARPQFGIASAPVVYEVPVEGGFTRYMLLFAKNQTVDRVGPVRSARDYFLDWQAEYGLPLYLHSGGSPTALARLKKGDYNDVNEFYNEHYFWRDHNLVAPHNLFTSSSLWQKYFDAHPNLATSSWQGWQFDESASVASTTASEVRIRYRPDYEVGWSFDGGSGRYLRELNGQAGTDAAGQNIYANSVILQYVRMLSVDELDRKQIFDIGDGSARVLRDGRIIYGQWFKDSVNGRTVFKDLAGQEIKLKPGTVWVQVVPEEATVTVAS